MQILTQPEAAEVLERTPRRVRQLVISGDLEAGAFPGSVTIESVVAYKARLEAGKIKRGPKPKKEKKNGSQKAARKK